MNAKQLFEHYPDANDCYVVGQDAFLIEENAADHAAHFNLSIKTAKRTDFFNEVVEMPNQNLKQIAAATDHVVVNTKAKPSTKIDEPAKEAAVAKTEEPAKEAAVATIDTPA